MNENLADILIETTKRHGDRPVVRLDETVVTYAALEEASARVAGLLRERGVAVGDRVGIMVPNVPAFPVIYYGILRAGGIVVPMNVLLKGREVSFYVGDPGVKLLLAWGECGAAAEEGASQAGAEVIVVGPGELESLLEASEPVRELAQRAAGESRRGHGVPGRADDVPRAAAPPRARPLRHVEAAAVRVGRRGVARRGAARLRGSVRRGDPRGLRAQRDVAGGVFQPPRARAQARIDRHADRRRADEGRRRRRQRGCPGRGRRDRHPRPQCHEGLLEPARRDGGGHARRLVPQRRHGADRRGRLLLHRRPQEGHDPPWRLQRVSAGDRGGPLRASCGLGGGGRRPARREAGRGGRRRDRPQARRRGRRRRPARLRQATRCRLQVPAQDLFVDELPKGPTGKILKREIKVPDRVAAAG